MDQLLHVRPRVQVGGGLEVVEELADELALVGGGQEAHPRERHLEAVGEIVGRDVAQHAKQTRGHSDGLDSDSVPAAIATDAAASTNGNS